MATRNKICRVVVSGLSIAAIAICGHTQTAPSAVPVPFSSGVAGFGTPASSTCGAGLVATDGTNYGDGCVGNLARLSSPQGAAVDKFGNVYIGDYSDRLVRVVYNGGANLAAAITAANSGYAVSATRSAPATVPVVGNIYTLAGVGASGVAALAVTASDGKFECANYAATGQPEALNSLGDGCPAAAAPIGARDVTVDADGNLFLTDYTNSRIRVMCVNCAASTLAAQLITLENPGVTPVNGAMYTIAGYTNGYRDGYIGFGNATTAMTGVSLLRSPTSAALSSNDDVYIGDDLNNAVRLLYNGGTAARNILVAQGTASPQLGFVYTIAGADCVSAALNKTGSTTSANSCLTTTPGGLGSVATADTAAPGFTGSTTVAGTPATAVSVAWTVYLDPSGNVFYSDSGNNRIKVIYAGIAPPLTLPNATYPTLQTGYSYSFAGQGTGSQSGVAPSAVSLGAPQGVGGDTNGNIFFMDYNAGLFYETYAQNGLTAIIGGGNAITTPTAGAYCNGGTTGPVLTDAFYNGCPLTQVKIANPRGPIVADGSGNLYFGDSPGYFVRKFSYNSTFPSTVVGATSAPQPYAFTFLSARTLTAPVFTVNGAAGADFGDAGGSTCIAGLAASAGAPGTTCVVNVAFSPKLPGVRSGAVELTSPAGVIGTSLMSGSGNGAALAVDPGTMTTTGNGVSANGIAVDGLGRVLVTDATSKSLIRYTGGVAATVATGFAAPTGVAIDGAGNIYVADSSANTITEIPVTGSRFTLSSSVSAPNGLATDGLGNLYVADTGNNRVLMFGPGATVPTVAGFSGLNAPQSVAVDASANVYVSDATQVYKLTPTGVQSSTGAGPAKAVAMDAAGDVVVIQGTSLVQYSGGVSSSVPVYILPATPKAIALDGAGNAFVAAGSGYVELQRTAGYYQFATSPASGTVYLSSIGTASLTAPTYTAQTDKTDFSLTPATSNPCSGAMAPTVTCGLTTSFSPTVAGTLTDLVTFGSNATNGSPITLTLTGTTSAQTTATALSVSPATLVYGNVETLTATVSGTLTTPTSGTVNFYRNVSTLLGSGNVASGGIATLNFVPPAGSYSVTAVYVPSDLTYVSSTSAAKTFGVTPAVLKVTANDASKVFGAANPSFTYSVTGFVNSDIATGAVTGAPSETTSATASSAAGTYPIAIAQGTLAAANYTLTFVNGTLSVTGATAQTITFGALSNVTYGVSPIALSGTASSGKTVSYTVTGPAVVTGSTLMLTGAGTVAVTANQVGDNTYAAATPVTQTFTVVKAPLTFTATSASRVYGSANAALSYTATGFVNGDTQVTGTTGAPSESTAALASSAVGPYPVTITQGTLVSSNYSFVFVNGNISVTPATLTATANSATRVYGAANPTFGGTLTGAVNGDALTETFSTAAVISSPAGTYPIVPSATGTNVGNYTISATNGTLTVTQAKPAITLSVSPTSGFNGATTITLTATLAAPTSGAPTGNVTFYSGTAAVGTVAFVGSTATLTTTALPVGSDSITAVYLGDTNFSTVTSSAIVATIAAGFSVTPGGTALSFQAGYQQAQTFLTINPGGRTDTLTFACQGLPAKLSCAFSPATLPLSGLTSTQSVQMLVSNSGAKANLDTPGGRVIALAALPLAAMLLFGFRRKRLPTLLLVVLLSLGAAVGLSGCGSSAAAVQQSGGTYPFTVTVTSGSATLQTLSFTIVVPGN